MRKPFGGLQSRIDRLESTIAAGCNDCRDTRPERIWCATTDAEGAAVGEPPQTEECSSCGRVIPIRWTVVAMSAADAAL